MTSEQLAFTTINGPIPNRGLLRPDMNMFGLTYRRQIPDKNLNAGSHLGPGSTAVRSTAQRATRDAGYQLACLHLAASW